MKNPKVRQVVLPLITALIWGSAFVTQSLSAAHLGCFSFNALRAIPAVLVLLVLLAVMQRIHPREKYSAEEKRALLRGGLVCGAIVLHERMSLREYFGCALMLAAVILSQLPEKSAKAVESGKKE